MKRYTRTKQAKVTVVNYLERLDANALQDLFNSSAFYGIAVPGLKKKMMHELQRRSMAVQPTLF